MWLQGNPAWNVIDNNSEKEPIPHGQAEGKVYEHMALKVKGGVKI
jgi:hypothetical protein